MEPQIQTNKKNTKPKQQPKQKQATTTKWALWYTDIWRFHLMIHMFFLVLVFLQVSTYFPV